MKYHKIQTIYKRNPKTKFKTLLDGEFSIPEFEYLANNEWVWTEKVDGTNLRIYWDGEKVKFGGRTDNAQIPLFLYDKLDEIFIPDKFSEFPALVLYGEGYGARIQKGGGNYISDGVDFILFDIRIGNYWLKREDTEDIAVKLGIKIVPIVGGGTLYEAVEFTRNGFESNIGTQLAEGLVLRPKVELACRNGNRVIAKLKHRDF